MKQQVINFTAPDAETAKMIAQGIHLMLSFGSENLLEYALDTFENTYSLYIRERVAL